MKSSRGPWANPVLAGLMRGGLWLAQLCSPTTAWRLSGWGAYLLFWSNGRAARITRINLQTCFPELNPAQLRAQCLLSLQHMVLLVFEFGQLAYWPEEKLLAQISEVRGQDLLDAAYADAPGILLLTPHFGNWEILCAFLGKNYTLAALYDPPKLASLEPVIIAAREKYQGRMFPIDTPGLRGMFKHLQAGGLVAVLPDQVPERSAGVYAEFFGQSALTMNLAHRLMTKFKPSVIVGSVRRETGSWGYRYVLHFEEGPVAHVGDEVATITAMNRAIETVVRRAPEQYQWEYKRFKRPPGASRSSIYRRQ